MDPDSKRLLELVEENNRLLRALHRSMRVGRVLRVIYWILIMGTALGAFYFLQPLIDQLISAYKDASSVLKNFTPR